MKIKAANEMKKKNTIYFTVAVWSSLKARNIQIHTHTSDLFHFFLIVYNIQLLACLNALWYISAHDTVYVIVSSVWESGPKGDSLPVCVCMRNERMNIKKRHTVYIIICVMCVSLGIIISRWRLCVFYFHRRLMFVRNTYFYDYFMFGGVTNT